MNHSLIQPIDFLPQSFDEELEGHDRNVRILMDAVTVPLQKYEDWLEGLPKKERCKYLSHSTLIDWP